MTHARDKIRSLNDEFRRHLTGGTALITAGVAALGPEAVGRIIQTIVTYDAFCQANDPHRQHDFGAFEAEGASIFFKIDYYSKSMQSHSPDPADPTVTERVMTVMLAAEW